MNKILDTESQFYTDTHCKKSEDTITFTIDFWRERGISLTHEEAKEAIENMDALFSLITRWNNNKTGQ